MTATWNGATATFQDDDFVDDDFLLEVCGIRSQPETNPPILQNPSNGSLRVHLDEEKHIFRHAKEVQKGSRGGYLKGRLPSPPSKVTSSNPFMMTFSKARLLSLLS